MFSVQKVSNEIGPCPACEVCIIVKVLFNHCLFSIGQLSLVFWSFFFLKPRRISKHCNGEKNWSSSNVWCCVFHWNGSSSAISSTSLHQEDVIV